VEKRLSASFVRGGDLMGGRGAYSRTNGFADGKTENEFFNYNNMQVDGIKVLSYHGSNNAKLPEYANTSSEYIAINSDGELTQLRVYVNHFPYADIDLGHSHHWGLNAGDVHVHPFLVGKDGHPIRMATQHPQADDLIKKYKTTIQKMKRTFK
jgi:hypothetical protein